MAVQSLPHIIKKQTNKQNNQPQTPPNQVKKQTYFFL